ncbi:MAE_28990/MAE_18760 family HEPN-like nuclease [Buttiauxella agrestis]|nr:MAE_28990/MAE_18760 family HEPN-like nuclease [Buttiauxella agrestis]
MEEINETNSWRDREFAKFRVNPHQVESILWGRMCVPMIYANWEGFVVSSLKMLLQHLNNLGLTPLQIPTRLVVVGLGDTYRSLSGKQSFEQRCIFTDKFNELLRNTVRFKTKIETKSNLHSEVLKELCQMFDFDFERFSDVKSTLDRLVHVRNCIAHGENSILPTQENIENFIDAVKQGIDILMDEIDIFLMQECYLYQQQA